MNLKKTLPTANKNGKPSLAHKVVGNKVPQGKTCGAASKDALEVQAKLTQHQKMLHQAQHHNGLYGRAGSAKVGARSACEKGGACQWGLGHADGSRDVQKGARKGGQDAWVGASNA